MAVGEEGNTGTLWRNLCLDRDIPISEAITDETAEIVERHSGRRHQNVLLSRQRYGQLERERCVSNAVSFGQGPHFRRFTMNSEATCTSKLLSD